MTMQLNTIKPGKGARKKAKRVGRGTSSGIGKTCGRGVKGQKSRSGVSISASFEGGQMPLQRRIPKFGFTSRVGKTVSEIRLHELALVDAEVIDLEALRKAGLIRADIKRARVIASGKIEKAVTIKGLYATKGAKAAIEGAGGKVLD